MADTSELREELNKNDLARDVLEHYPEGPEREAAMMALEAVGYDTSMPMFNPKEGEPEEDTGAETGGEPEAKAEPEPPTQSAEVIELNKRLAEAEARLEIANSEPEINRQVDEKMAERISAYNQARTEAEEDIKKYEEEYGEEAAARLRETTEQNLRLREQENERAREDYYNEIKAAHESQINSQAGTHADIVAHPDMAAWLADARAVSNGDTTKNGTPWQLAVAIDQMLEGSEHWKDKPRVERFGEVVKRVKAQIDATAPGALDQASETGDKSTQQKIAEEIANRARGKTDAVPGSLTEAPGGESSDVNVGSVESLDTMGFHELSRMPRDQFERLADLVNED